MSQPSLHPIHVDSPAVQAAVEAAVKAACAELDMLFVGAKPEINGVSSNFAGLLERHIKAMLTGEPAARRYGTGLPVLLATDEVFGKPFALPAEPGYGYMVKDTVTGRVLSAYSKRFFWLKQTKAVGGQLIEFYAEDPDVLFSTFEAATQAALEALRYEEYSPATRPIEIVAAAWDDDQGTYTEYVWPPRMPSDASYQPSSGFSVKRAASDYWLSIAKEGAEDDVTLFIYWTDPPDVSMLIPSREKAVAAIKEALARDTTEPNEEFCIFRTRWDEGLRQYVVEPEPVEIVDAMGKPCKS